MEGVIFIETGFNASEGEATKLGSQPRLTPLIERMPVHYPNCELLSAVDCFDSEQPRFQSASINTKIEVKHTFGPDRPEEPFQYLRGLAGTTVR
ncbi:hypothetical protein BLA27_07465 [Brucella cytisi]|uniref:Uncharacterized protein n=1 Tax=Brucella cytisi TaxID=407152 RepID=A0A1J6HPK8_9HYPH|nr:hypothetical protein BLA27_07465 [Brucella cytisi]